MLNVAMNGSLLLLLLLLFLFYVADVVCTLIYYFVKQMRLAILIPAVIEK